MAISFEPIQTGDQLLNRMQLAIKVAITALAKGVLVGGRLTDQIALTTSFQDIPHGLGRPITGWIAVSPDAQADIWQDGVVNINPARFMRLKASAAVNCRFLVF